MADSPASNPDSPQPRKATLGQFIENHSKLLTSIAAFIALTVFSTQLDSELKLLISALSLLCAVILGLELMAQIPPDSLHWRLELFSKVLPPLIVLLAWYWFPKFQVLWVPLGFQLIQLLIIVGIAALFTRLVMMFAGRIARLAKRDLSAKTTLRISQGAFVLSACFLIAALFWLARRLAAHPVTIHFTSAK